MSTGDGYIDRYGRNGELCVAVVPDKGSGRLGLYASFIGFNRFQPKGPQLLHNGTWSVQNL